jgi:YcaO-like protein with predicted kinase domain
LTLDALTSAEAGIINSISRSRIFAPDYGWKDNAAASSFIPIDIDSIIDLPIAGLLIQKITAAGAGINVHEITSDIGIPVFSASINGFISGEDGGGLGAHPDAELALLRAITEAVQQRLVLGIQRMVSFTSPVQRWKPANWEINKPNQAVIGNKKRFDAIPSTRNKDVLNDIQMIIASLQERGFHQIIIVNLTKPDLGIPVVKVVVPGLADYWTASTIPQWKTLMNRVQSSENRFQSMSKETQYVRQI